MATRVIAADIIRELPQEALNSSVSDLHIAELASEMKNWEQYVPYLGLTEAEEDEIRRDNPSRYRIQKREVLRKWKAKQGSAATYRQLIIVFCLHNTDLAEKVKQLLHPELRKQPTKNSVLDTFRKYLVDCYIETPHPSHTQWPFSGMSAYIDLTLLEVPENPLRLELNQSSPQVVLLGELFSAGHRNTRRKVILIEGPAGSGKTTLMWYACRKWAGSRLFPEVNLLIHISLKDPAFHSAKCLADIIPHPSSEMREAVAIAIANQHGKGICFLFDSWDEVPCHCLELNPYLHCFIAGTSGKMLPCCSIVVTSRPVGALPLYPLLTARLIVGCFGYSEIEKFIDANLDGIGDTKEKLLEAFRRNPRLVGLCNLPINAAIVIHLFNSFNHKLPLTRTELFMALVSNILVRHMQLRTLHGLQGVPSFDSLPEDIYQKLNQVCSLAFHGIMESRSVFGVEALKAVGVASHIVLDTLGLLQVHQQLTGFGPQHRYSFLHYAVQEFLAAYHISKLTSEEQFKVVSQIFHNNPLSPVLPFYAGLTKLSNSSVCSMLMEVTKKPLDMGSAMVSMLQNPTGSKFSNSNKLLLVLVNCIYESQRKDVCKLVDFPHAPLNPSCYVSFQGLRLDPMYCMSLGYFLANKQLDKICTLVLNDCCVGDIGIEVFMKELSQGCVLKEATGVKLVLSGNDCSRHSVKYISETMSQTPMLWGLHFMGWILFGLDTAVLLKYLIEGVCKRSARCRCIALSQCVSYKHIYHLTLLIVFGNLLILNLSYNDIGRSSVMSLLMQSLKHSRKLVTLHMNDCNISDGGLQHLGSALQDHKTITSLAITNNPFSSEALTSFLEQLCTVHSRLLYLHLELQRCKPLKPEHSALVQRINYLRWRLSIPPLTLSELKTVDIVACLPHQAQPT